MKDKVLTDIFIEVAQELNLEPSQVEGVFDSGYKTLYDSINEGVKGDPLSFKFVKIPFLGKFIIRMSRVRYFAKFKGYGDVYPYAKKREAELMELKIKKDLKNGNT